MHPHVLHTEKWETKERKQTSKTYKQGDSYRWAVAFSNWVHWEPLAQMFRTAGKTSRLGTTQSSLPYADKGIVCERKMIQT